MQNLYVHPPTQNNLNGQEFPTFFPNMGSYTAEPISSNSSSDELLNLDLMMTDSGIDQQWRSFMRDSGLLDRGLNPGRNLDVNGGDMLL